MTTPLNALDYGLTRPVYNVSETLELLSVGRTTLYAEINAGRLRATKHGSKTVFLAPDIVAFLNVLRAEPIGKAA